MKVYRVDSPFQRKVSDSPGIYIDVKNLVFSKIETASYQEKYGVNLSRYEIEYHRFMLQILKHFLDNSKDKWCMIYDKGVKITKTMGEIEESLDVTPKSTDVFFPFDKAETIKKKAGLKVSGSRFDTYWGSYFFCISRPGVRKILSQLKFSLPFDEMLLELSFSGKISTLFADTNWFKYDEKKSKSYNARRNQVKKAVFASTAWKHEEKQKAIALLSNLVEHAKKLNIKLMLHAGSLLGSIRHDGIMPWDDDIDISILAEDLEILNNSIRKEGIIQITKWVYKKTGSTYFKYWLEGGEKVDGYEFSFPFIDFWIVYPNGTSKIKMTDGYVFDRADYFPARPITFEGISLNTPNKPMVVLDEMYKTWKTEINVFSWCHRLKKPIFNPLKMQIDVDVSGKMIS